MNNLEKMYTKKFNEYFTNYNTYLHKLLNEMDTSQIEKVVECFLKVRAENKKIFFAGNGGSAATASHFAQDIGEIGKKSGKKGFKTLSINDNTSLLTAIANDYGYEKVFSIQVESLMEKGDALVVLSASGNSKNVVEAVNYAKTIGGKTIGLVGFEGGKLKEICDYVLHVKSDTKEYGPVEDVHMILDHLIQSYLIEYLRREA